MSLQAEFLFTFFFAWRGFREKMPGKGLFIDVSNEYKFTYVARWVGSEKRVFDERWRFIFPEKTQWVIMTTASDEVNTILFITVCAVYGSRRT